MRDEGVLTSEPHRPRVTVPERRGPRPPGGEDRVRQHPQHGEEEEEEEEGLPVHSRDTHAFGAAGDQSAAQDQDVDADDA